jgi:hypothetical protein
MSDDAIDMLAMDFWTFRNFKLHDDDEYCCCFKTLRLPRNIEHDWLLIAVCCMSILIVLPFGL